MKRVFDLTQLKIEKKKMPDFRVGDLVKVHRRVKEGNKERIQIIEGEIIVHKHGKEPGATITVRRVTLGVAVEMILPVYSPNTENIIIVKRQKVRRAKLYYLRRVKGKKRKLAENVEVTRKIKKEEAINNERLKAEEKKQEKKSEKQKKTKEKVKHENVSNKSEQKQGEPEIKKEEK